MQELAEMSLSEAFITIFTYIFVLVLPIFIGYKLLKFIGRIIGKLISESRTHYSPFTKTISIHVDPDEIRKINAIAKKNRRSPRSQIEYMVKTEIENYEIVHGRILDDL